LTPAAASSFRIACAWVALGLGIAAQSAAQGTVADRQVDVIARVKRSVVAIGTFEATRAPPFEFRGTGFAVADGSIVVTNAHVVDGAIDVKRREIFGILVPGPDAQAAKFREVHFITADANVDLALLKLDGAPLPALEVADSESVKEGQSILFTGFPIGSVLGAHPATHRGMVAAITPIAIPQRGSGNLNPKMVRRLGNRPLAVFQLDATAYPGNSGSPVFEPDTGAVVGVINMVFVKGTKESTLRAPSGISYAIPARNLMELLQRAR
jgi:S1-C subfamily serine protease